MEWSFMTPAYRISIGVAALVITGHYLLLKRYRNGRKPGTEKR